MDTETINIAELVAQARAAYQQTRFKECLALTKELLLVDPANSAALQLQTAIRSDMQRDVSDAGSLIEESRDKPDAQKYSKAAEIILLKALYLDPDNESAKKLLSSIRGTSEISAPPSATAEHPAFTPQPAPQVEHHTGPEVMPVPAHKPVYDYDTPQDTAVKEEIPFTTGVTQMGKPRKKEKKTSVTVPIVVVAIVLFGGGLLLFRGKSSNVPTAVAASTSVDSTHTDGQAAARNTSYPISGSVAPAVSNPPAPTIVSTVNEASPKTTLAALTTAPPLPAGPSSTVTPTANSRNNAVNGTATGTLAVSSPIAAEIFMGDKHLGSTPTTLQLPAGNQTLEYRHGNLRSVVTHVVKANDTITALITFDVVVQLNAKPWAQVFIEGTARLPLGQTPLSDVRLPVGSVLVFENPKFPSKSHKITVDDTTIQMVFQ